MSLSQGDRENAEVVEFHAEFVKSGLTYKLIHFRLSASAHDPWLLFPINEDFGNHLNLRVPGLIGVQEKATGLYQVA